MKSSQEIHLKFAFRGCLQASTCSLYGVIPIATSGDFPRYCPNIFIIRVFTDTVEFFYQITLIGRNNLTT